MRNWPPEPLLAAYYCVQQTRNRRTCDSIANAAKLGIGVGLLVRITLKSQVDRELKAFETAVRAVPEVVECYLTTGESDYVLREVTRGAALPLG